MTDLTRRTLVKTGTAAAGLGAMTASGLGEWAKAWAQASQWKSEAGATLNLLRFRRFIQLEEDAFTKIIEAFTQATGVKVTVSSESIDDVQPKAAVAANVGSGPDLVWSFFSLAHLFPTKVVDVSDVAEYLGKKYGGWVPLATAYGKKGDTWVNIPVTINGQALIYRVSSVKEAGFDKVPQDTAGFLELCRAMQAKNKPAGMALGFATGDANVWIHWALWAFGGSLVDEKNKVSIDSPETKAALDYVAQLYKAFITGTASWNDASNNKAYLSGECHLTNNGYSLYISTTNDAKAIAADSDHSTFPIGPVGKPSEFQIPFTMMLFKHCKYPNAAKAFMAFLLEADQYNAWLQSCIGYLSHSLNAYAANPVWTSGDPKKAVFRDPGLRSFTTGYKGDISEQSQAALADFILVDMFASVATGRMPAEDAMRLARRKAERIYRSA